VTTHICLATDQTNPATAILRIVSDWCIEANEVGGVEAGDLAYRLEQAGFPLPDDDREQQ
jgi:hypothetical protein